MKRIGDEELLNRQFRYDDPEGIPDLRRDRPDPSLDPEIVGYYQVRPAGGRNANSASSYIWCCHCQKPTHWDGRVVQDRSGGTYIIGIDCGRKHYGDKFVAIDRTFEDQLARQKLLHRWSGLLESKTALLEEVDTVLKDGIWRTIDLKRQELDRLAPDLVFRLKPMVKRGASLIIRSRVRDHQAEARREQSFQRAMERYRKLSKAEKAEARREGLKPEADDRPIFRDVEENLGPVQGRHAVSDDGDVRSCAMTLKKLLAAVPPIDQLGSVKNTELSRSLRNIAEAATGLRAAFVETASAWTFFTPENLDRVERWYRNIRPTPFLNETGATQTIQGPLSSAIAPLVRESYYYPPTLDKIAQRNGEREADAVFD